MTIDIFAMNFLPESPMPMFANINVLADEIFIRFARCKICGIQ